MSTNCFRQNLIMYTEYTQKRFENESLKKYKRAINVGISAFIALFLKRIMQEFIHFIEKNVFIMDLFNREIYFNIFKSYE